MTITAKFPSTCAGCNGAIAKGDRIEWTRGRPARHANCERAEVSHMNAESDAATWTRTAACWKCKSPDGRFRSYGAATPVYCDPCEVIARRKSRGLCPTCGETPISRAYIAKGYQCDACADREEGGAW